MAFVGNLSGSTATSSEIGITGSVIIAAPAVGVVAATAFGALAVGTDATLFVSGTTGGIDVGEGVTVLGGDMVVSGGVVIGYAPTESADGTTQDFTIHTKNQQSAFVVHGNNSQVQVGAANAAGSEIGVGDDVFFQVSGALGGINGDVGDLSVFGGDMLVSGGLTVGFEPTESADGNAQNFTVHGKNASSLFQVDGDTGDVVVGGSGADGNSTAVGTDTFFFVSGAIGHKGQTDRTTISTFGGDMVVSGNTYFEMGLSGSLTRLTDGSSYLEAGSNVTITSSSNGAVTIASSGGSGSPGGSDTQVQFNNADSFDGAADLTFNTSTGDVTVGASTGDAKLFFRDAGLSIHSPSDGDLKISADGAAADAILLTTSNAAGGIDMDAGTGGVTIDSTGAISIDSVGATNLTTHGALTLSGSDSINLLSHGGLVSITSTQGGVDIDANGTLALDGAGGINIGTAADVAFDVDTAALDIDSSGAITIDGTSTLSMDAVGATNLTTNGALTLSGSTGLNVAADSGEIDITARQGAIDINATAGAITLDAGGAISLDGAAASNLTTSSGALTLAGASLDVDATSGAFNIAATAASTVTTSGGTLTMDGQTGVNLQENGTTVISIDDSRNVTIGNATSSETITIGHSTSETTVGDNLTVTGDLIVQGTTTTISSSNMIIEDSIIGLGVSGSNAGDWNNVGDRGLIFARAASAFAALPGFWWNGSKFIAATSLTSPTSGSFGAVSDYEPILVGKIEIDSANAYISHDGTDLQIVDDADINLKPAADLLVDAGSNIILDADGGEITLKDGGTAFAAFNTGGTAGLCNIENGAGNAVILIDDGDRNLYFFDKGGEYIKGDGTDLTLVSGGDIILTPGGGDVLPDGDNTRNLGSASKRWANVYTGDLHLANDRGDWTMVEESTYLSLTNNKTGKTYRLLMEEVENDDPAPTESSSNDEITTSSNKKSRSLQSERRKNRSL